MKLMKIVVVLVLIFFGLWIAWWDFPFVDGGLTTVDGAKLPWPVGDGETAYPIGNAYGQYENYSGSSGYHRGIDVMVSDSPAEDVYAIQDGTVDFTHGSAADPVNYGVIILSTDDPTTGFYYTHFEPAGGAHVVTSTVAAGDLLGTTVGWSYPTDYDHLHVSRVRVETSSSASSLFPFEYDGNPLASLKNADDAVDPEIVDVLFFKNESTSELEPADLSGDVDIVVEVEDRFLASTDHPLIPYRARVEITRTSGDSPVYENEIEFDGHFDTATSTFISTAYKKDGSVDLKGDYDDRRFFVVVTNRLPEDASAAWSTSSAGSGDYEVRVTAGDLSGREVEKIMTVTIP